MQQQPQNNNLNVGKVAKKITDWLEQRKANIKTALAGLDAGEDIGKRTKASTKRLGATLKGSEANNGFLKFCPYLQTTNNMKNDAFLTQQILIVV